METPVYAMALFSEQVQGTLSIISHYFVILDCGRKIRVDRYDSRDTIQLGTDYVQLMVRGGAGNRASGRVPNIVLHVSLADPLSYRDVVLMKQMFEGVAFEQNNNNCFWFAVTLASMICWRSNASVVFEGKLREYLNGTSLFGSNRKYWYYLHSSTLSFWRKWMDTASLCFVFSLLAHPELRSRYEAVYGRLNEELFDSLQKFLDRKAALWRTRLFFPILIWLGYNYDDSSLGLGVAFIICLIMYMGERLCLNR